MKNIKNYLENLIETKEKEKDSYFVSFYNSDILILNYKIVAKDLEEAKVKASDILFKEKSLDDSYSVKFLDTVIIKNFVSEIELAIACVNSYGIEW